MNPTQGQNDRIARALAELERIDPGEQLAALDALQKKRIKKQYIKYFKPWEPDQADALRKFTERIKIFALLGGNRSGKTILGAFLSVAWCLGKKYFEGEPAWEWIQNLPIPVGPVNVWVVGVDFGTLRDVIWHEKLRHGKSHPPFLPDDSSTTKISDGDFQIFFKNGSILTGKSAEAGRDKFQGASVDFIWIDEECERAVFDECYQRTIDCNGKILLTQTPLTDINSAVREPWVYDLHEEFQAGKQNVMFCELSMLNSPFISQEEKDAAIAKWAGHPEEGARLYGKFVRRTGLVYAEWNRALHIVKPFSIPRHWIRVVSIDPAATGITAALWLAVNPEGDYFAYREYYETDRTVSEHAKSILLRNAGDPVDYWLLDPFWARQRNNETHKDGQRLYTDAGIPVRLPEVGKDGYAVNLSREFISASAIPGSRHAKFHAFEGLPNFEYEIGHYTWDAYSKGEQKGQSKEKPRKRHDHLMNAMQYAFCLQLKARRRSGAGNGSDSQWLFGQSKDGESKLGYNPRSYT